eukprot:11381229-Heterocapsa_arctica.AAC.1
MDLPVKRCSCRRLRPYFSSISFTRIMRTAPWMPSARIRTVFRWLNGFASLHQPRHSDRNAPRLSSRTNHPRTSR